MTSETTTIGAGSPTFGIVANVREDKILRRGARVLILHCDGDAEIYIVRGLSLSGRRCDKRIPAKRLYRFRATWVPERDRDAISDDWIFDTKTDAQSLAAKLAIMWEPVRSYRHDGTQIKDGDTPSGAFSRARHVVELNKAVW
jgi:hypothetical protein